MTAVPSYWTMIDEASTLLIAKRGIEGYARFLQKLANMELFFTKTADMPERAIHKFIIKELVSVYGFKDSDDLLNGRTHQHSMARAIGIYLLKENTNFSLAQISTLYRKTITPIRTGYKNMKEIKDSKGNTQQVRNFRLIESSLQIYIDFLTNYEQYER